MHTEEKTFEKPSHYKKFAITNEEYEALDKQFRRLCYKAMWDLKYRNHNNKCVVETEQDDVMQEIIMHVIKAGCYYKRQVYIEECLEVTKKFCDDSFVKNMIEELEKLWNSRTKHGANKRKFGNYQEELLEDIVIKVVPLPLRPDAKAPLKMDAKFLTYCKAIAWNSQKAIGKRITKERSIRAGMVSLSTNDFII